MAQFKLMLATYSGYAEQYGFWMARYALIRKEWDAKVGNRYPCPYWRWLEWEPEPAKIP